jgi:molecular chaperone GrpE (heat shock protein)
MLTTDILLSSRDKVSVKFPTTSAKTSHSTSAKTMSSFFHLRADIEEKIVKKKEEKKMLEKQIRRTRDKLKRLKNNFENKKKELEEREARKNMFLENCQQRGLLLENHEQSDKIIDF